MKYYHSEVIKNNGWKDQVAFYLVIAPRNFLEHITVII